MHIDHFIYFCNWKKVALLNENKKIQADQIVFYDICPDPADSIIAVNPM